MTQHLQEERTRLAGIIEGTGAGTWEWNVQTGETRFNERWAEMLGYRLDEIAPDDKSTRRILPVTNAESSLAR